MIDLVLNPSDALGAASPEAADALARLRGYLKELQALQVLHGATARLGRENAHAADVFWPTATVIDFSRARNGVSPLVAHACKLQQNGTCLRGKQALIGADAYPEIDGRPLSDIVRQTKHLIALTQPASKTPWGWILAGIGAVTAIGGTVWYARTR